MTVLAWKEGIFAADSQVTGGGYVMGNDRKIYSKSFKGVRTWAGGIGDSVKIQYFVELYLKSKTLEAIVKGWRAYGEKNDDGKTSGIIVFDEVDEHFGQKYWAFYDNSWPQAQLFFKNYMAWGSGDELALGTMYMGGTALDAVNAAIRFDTGCGLPLQWIDTAGKFQVV